MTKSKSESYVDEEIDLLKLFNILLDNKKKILIFSSFIAFLSVFFTLTLPNIYRAEALLAPAGMQRDTGMSGLAGRFGGLASLAGISIDDEVVSKHDLGLEVLKSRKFIREFVDRHKIIPELMAVDYWNADERKLYLDKSLYNPKTKKWLKKDGKPSNEDVYELFIESLIIVEDATSEFVTIGFKHQSPDIAAKWTGQLIKDINDEIRNQDISEAESSIEYLSQQIDNSPAVDLRDLFYDLIQTQTETMMLANVREEYIFKTIDPATVPEEKSEPRRAIICLVSTFLGGFFAIIYVIFRHYLITENS